MANVTISGDKTITLNEAFVKVEFKTDEREQMICHHSQSIFVDVTISGTVIKDVTEQLIQIFDWSRDFSENGVYRTVTIKEKQENDTNFMRTYIFPKMFVLGYSEKMGTDNASMFELRLRQRKGELNTIETFQG